LAPAPVYFADLPEKGLTNWPVSYIVHFMNYLETNRQLSEELLSTWLRLGSVINNQRLVSGLSFNEAQVCGLLTQPGGCRTASELCARTRILKSQMNAILLSLEKRGLITRQQDPADRRRIEIRLSPAGISQYQEAHRPVLDMAGRLVGSMGEEKVRQLLPLLRQAADTFERLQKEA